MFEPTLTLLGQTSAWSGIPVGEHLWVFSPMIALIATMLAVVACPIVVGRSARTIARVATLGVIVTLGLTLATWGAVSTHPVSGLSTHPASGMLIADNLSIGFQIILMVFLLGVIYLWKIGSAGSEENAPEFFVLLLGSALGMILMVSTSNLLMIVLGIEMASLPSYAIVGFDKRDRKGAEASVKYMIFGAVCAAIMLYGVSLLYGMVGSLSVTDLARYTVDQFAGGRRPLLLSVGLLCLLAGPAFKISAVPFHFWCPDAFEGARIEVTTWLSVASKAAGLILLARVVDTFAGAVEEPLAMSVLKPLAWTIGIMAAVTCTLGNFAAYPQQSVKRLLAYSSIAHAGYMMMATAVFLHPQADRSGAPMAALVFYIIVYVFMNLGAFGVTALVSWETGSDRIEGFTGLMRRAPWLAVPMVVCLISLVGLPPLAGFLAKWWVLVALGSLADGWGANLAWFLIIVAVVNTLISLYYYLRIVVLMVLRDTGEPAVHSPIGGLALVNLCALMLFGLLVAGAPLKATADRFSRNLFDATAVTPPAGAPVADALDRAD